MYVGWEVVCVLAQCGAKGSWRRPWDIYARTMYILVVDLSGIGPEELALLRRYRSTLAVANGAHLHSM